MADDTRTALQEMCAKLREDIEILEQALPLTERSEGYLLGIKATHKLAERYRDEELS